MALNPPTPPEQPTPRSYRLLCSLGRAPDVVQLLECSECAAMVGGAGLDAHDEWHDELREVLQNLINTRNPVAFPVALPSSGTAWIALAAERRGSFE
jgi:hypothetical protein